VGQRDPRENVTEEKASRRSERKETLMAYMGFDKLKGKLAHKPGITNPGALAASIGRKKYGKKKFQSHAAAGKSMRHVGVKGHR
jgi:hypothetical protein